MAGAWARHEGTVGHRTRLHVSSCVRLAACRGQIDARTLRFPKNRVDPTWSYSTDRSFAAGRARMG